MPDLNPQQFGEQLPLFPPNNKKWTRPLEHAEMTPEQFKTLPGAWFHATYHDQMPTLENRRSDPFQAGIHLGTKKAAEDRLVSLGPRKEFRRRQQFLGARMDAYVPMPADAPGEIHARRITNEAQFAKPPSKAERDYGGAWLSYPELDKSNYYKNRHEHVGSLSIRVADDSHITSHREAIDKALATGGRVHPLNRALIENHGGQGIDVPEKRTVSDKQHREYLRNHPGAGF